jgi:hypothetical protein
MKKSIFFLLLMSYQLAPITYFSHLSNAWYPAKGKKLRRQVEELKERAIQDFEIVMDPDRVKAILVPHAAYNYSGIVAAAAYQAVEKAKIKRIFIIGPSHYVPFQGVALPDAQYEKFGNDLGSISLDRKILKKLRMDGSGLFKSVQRAYDLEHSIEIQIPFIQAYFPTCSIIPLLLGDLDHQQFDQLANILRDYIDDEVLCVFTSDLTHYGQSFSYTPFMQDIPQNLVALDQNIVNTIELLSYTKFENVLDRTKATVCGYAPIKLLMKLFDNSNLESYVAAYDRSTHEQNPEHSVSYVSMIFSSQKRGSLELSNQLTGYEKMVLKKLVKQSLENLFNKTKSCSCDYILTNTLFDHIGAFVTLYDKNHQLRGCIGKIVADQPLYKTVCDMARASALEDFRFSAVKHDEISELSFEISVLTRPEKIDSYQKIKIGTDGIILKYQNRSSVFLPQVPVEQGWNLHETLQHLSIKAGLDDQAYKQEKAKFEIFQTIKIV